MIDKWRKEMIPKGYDVAQICQNGHVANKFTHRYPENNQSYCQTCGTATTTICPACHAPIRGGYWDPFGDRYEIPRFCINCGEPFPWTDLKIKAAKDLAGMLETINDRDRRDLEEIIVELTKDTPSIQIAAIRFKKIMDKAGSGAAFMFRDILTDVLSETARKILWP
jgi:hypothetical protein